MELHLRLPKITGRIDIMLNGQVFTSNHDGEVPKEMADFSKQVMGDAQFRVAVTTDLSFKENFGNGVSTSVTLSISCNQDDATIHQVVQTIGMWSREYCKQQQELGRAEYEKLKS